MSEDTMQRLMGLADEYGRWVPDLCMGGLYRGIATQRRAEARSTLESALREALSAFPVELEQPEQPLGDAADAAGLSAPALRASAAIPIAMTEKLGDMRHYLRETAGFASLAPRARENINTVLELLDELAALERAPAEKRRLDEIEHAQDRDYWRTERERIDSIDKDDEA